MGSQRRTLLSTATAAILAGSALAVVGLNAVAAPPPTLPGTAPQEKGLEFKTVRQCSLCHMTRGSTHYLQPYSAWDTGMMAHAGQNPLFLAALVIANQDIPDSGSHCLRCHTPRGWYAGRGKADGSELTEDDRRGITCDVCHRLVDPKSEEAAKFATFVPPDYGNAQLVFDTNFVVRGPYEPDSEDVRPHDNVHSTFQSSAELCASCHDSSNPYQAANPMTDPTHTYAPWGRTYSEWLSSSLSADGAEGDCQSCHYKKLKSGGQAAKYSGRIRQHYRRMGAPGGSTWSKRAVAFQNGRDVDQGALAAGVNRSAEMARTAAELELTLAGPGRAQLKITNLAGHKLPTGHPSGARMWVHVRFKNAAGEVIEERGVFGQKEDTLRGEPVEVSTLLDPERTKVWEVVSGLSRTQAAKYGLKPGPSHHLILNDVILADNRIPPRGFSNEVAKERLASPIGARFEDGANYDIVTWALPSGTKRVEARLLLQGASWSYVRFLIEENKTNDAGEQLWTTFQNTDMMPPEIVGAAMLQLP